MAVSAFSSCDGATDKWKAPGDAHESCNGRRWENR